MIHNTSHKQKRGPFFYFFIFFAGTLLIGGLIGYYFTFSPNTSVSSDKPTYLYIKTGATYNDVLKDLKLNRLMKSEFTFEFLAKAIDYPQNVKAGKYRISNGMSNKELLWKLRSGRQESVKLVFNNIRDKRSLAGRISKQIEADSASIMRLMCDNVELGKIGFDTTVIMAMFIPNTYEFHWNTNAVDFFNRMNSEYKKFWNTERQEKSTTLGLTPVNVSVLASIVEEETKKKDEMPVVAGVYLNRCKKGMHLEADPTLIFAIGDYTIKRVYDVHKAIDSPYNTYKYGGLPPGPIRIPSIVAIDAVLSAATHDYIYFCAKEDFSGYHNFAASYDQHMNNARKYQKELNKRNIKK